MRWSLCTAALGTLLLTGCLGGERFSVSDPSCETGYLEWAGGLTHHLVEGRPDGTFDYDPAGLVESRIVGAYDLSSGDFEYDVEYHPDHYRAGTTVEGYGYAATNGDLDVEYTLTTTDVLGAGWSIDVRDKRVGCEVARRVDYSNATVWHEGEFFADRYEYTDSEEVDGAPWVVHGVSYPDGSWVEELDYLGPSETYRFDQEGTGDGYSRRDWTLVDNATIYSGYTEYFLEGGRHVHYDVDGVTWDYTVDYEGDGSGTLTGSGYDCDLTFTDGDCAYDCASGQSGSC